MLWLVLEFELEVEVEVVQELVVAAAVGAAIDQEMARKVTKAREAEETDCCSAARQNKHNKI